MKLIVRLALLIATLTMATLVYADTKNVYGFIEKATLLPENFTLTAKLDTGAKTASLGASEIKQFKFHDEDWISFVVTTKEGKATFKRKLRKYVKIKSRIEETNSADKNYASRPEVLMRIKLGDNEKIIWVDLANRGNFNYALLLGRDAIKKFGGCVDPSEAFVVSKTEQSAR